MWTASDTLNRNGPTPIAVREMRKIRRLLGLPKWPERL
jgi:hypothetical protein